MKTFPRHCPLTALLLAAAIARLAAPAPAAESASHAAGGFAVSEGAESAGDAAAGHFQVGEDNSPPTARPESPVRMARFSYLKGDVTWRPDDAAEWTAATLNLPVRQGAQIWTNHGARAEVQFDDGSLLRLGAGAVVTLKTMYSDEKGEFTEVKLTSGLATLRLKHDRSIYQIDTPIVTVKTSNKSKVRVGVGDGTEVAVRDGVASVEGAQGRVPLSSGDYLNLPDGTAPYETTLIPPGDAWELWNNDRDRKLEDPARPAKQNLPANIESVAPALDDYGTWRRDPQYGPVWYPQVATTDWRPYSDGSWTWFNPFGWTWVSNEPWGWAPYHYGTWVRQPFGWGWVPGPVQQPWCPAVVHFTQYDGGVIWAPLAPGEIRYPSIHHLGYTSTSWGLTFSIHNTAAYYPVNDGYCQPYGWGNTYVNRFTNVYNTTVINPRLPSGPGPTIIQNTRFIPENARLMGGATMASTTAFAGRGGYQPVAINATPLFARPHPVRLPAAGQWAVAGPPGVLPRPAGPGGSAPNGTWTDAPRRHGHIYTLPQPGGYVAPTPNRWVPPAVQSAREGMPVTGLFSTQQGLERRAPSANTSWYVPSPLPRSAAPATGGGSTALPPAPWVVPATPAWAKPRTAPTVQPSVAAPTIVPTAPHGYAGASDAARIFGFAVPTGKASMPVTAPVAVKQPAPTTGGRGGTNDRRQ